MAHIGKERRFQFIGLQSPVTGDDKLVFGVFIALNALAHTQYHIRNIRRQTVISGTAELPPLVPAIRVLQPETHTRVRLVSQHDIIEMLVCTGQVSRMDNQVQLFPGYIPRIVIAVEALQQSAGEVETFQPRVVLPRIDGTLFDGHIEETPLHLLFGYVTADNGHTRQLVFRKDRNHLARNREISAFRILLHERLFRYNNRFLVPYHLLQQSLQDILAIHVDMENGAGNLPFVRTCHIRIGR